MEAGFGGHVGRAFCLEEWAPPLERGRLAPGRTRLAAAKVPESLRDSCPKSPSCSQRHDATAGGLTHSGAEPRARLGLSVSLSFQVQRGISPVRGKGFLAKPVLREDAERR